MFGPTLLQISAKLEEHESELKSKDLLAYLVTLATLNYAPKNLDKMVAVSAIKNTVPDVYKKDPA
jgi:hypothetical protein